VDGTMVYVTHPSRNDVIRIDVSSGTPSFAAGFVTGITGPAGIAVLNDQLIISASDGQLYAADKAAGGAAAVFGDANGYRYRAEAISVTAAGDLLLSQAGSSAVKRISSGDTEAQLVAAGQRLDFATLRIGDRVYLAGVGNGLFNNSGGPAPQDGSVIEVASDGTSRLIATGTFPIGLAELPNGELAVADCFERRIFSVNLTTLATTELVSPSDGARCPAAMAVVSGDLLFADADISGGSPGRVSLRASNGTITADFITGLAGASVKMVVDGNTVLSAAVGLGDGRGSVYSAPLAGGAATLLVPESRAGGLTAFARSPLGAVLIGRFGLGEILELDPSTGDLTQVGSVATSAFRIGQGNQGSMVLSFGFTEDGTIIAPDFGQRQIVMVAP